MKLSEVGEFGLIARISAGCPSGNRSHVVQGIGDDAAVVDLGGDSLQLVTTDLLVERVHFRRDLISPRQLGAKALAVNLSDIAAMGGTARDAYVAMAVPEDTPVEELDGLYAGIQHIAAATGTCLLGGDTSASPRDLFLAVTVVGEVARDQLMLRSAARVGDRILVTGTIGDSAAGLRVLLDSPGLPRAVAQPLVRAHLEPTPCLREGRILATSGHAHAAIDLSDGLLADLGHVCRASRVGAVIDSALLPLSAELRQLCLTIGEDPLRVALAGGEDYQLLATVAPEAASDLCRALSAATGCRASLIGEITAGDTLVLRHADGTHEALPALGHDHFRPPAR